MFTDHTLAAFSAEVSARTPTPGGGSVAAYFGSLGAALGAMAARFSQGQQLPADEALEDEIGRLEALRQELLGLVDADALAYGGVRRAYALPKSTPDEKATRTGAIRQALRQAMEPPRSVARLAVEGLGTLEHLLPRVTPHLVSDVGVGAHALGAAFRSAWLNVLVNLAGLKDEDLRRDVLGEGQTLGERARRLEDAVGEAVVARIAG